MAGEGDWKTELQKWEQESREKRWVEKGVGREKRKTEVRWWEAGGILRDREEVG